MALQPGRLFGNYRVVRPIGEGAFGEVYLAENRHINRRAAVKVLRPLLAQDADLVRRFFNEARAASAIRHPSIVDVYDAGETPEGFPYILMEFLEGASLKTRLADAGRLPVGVALEIAKQAGSALAAAHDIGIVHRDLKPDNLFLVPDASLPGGERVKILDFGIAKVKHAGAAASSLRTESGIIMGSPTYMSPEQCRGSADVDRRADIYSLGTIVYEMMGGRPPHVGATGVELLLMHLNETPRPLCELAPHVPRHAQDAVMRALRLDRSERFADVPSFLEALTQQDGTSSKEAPLGSPAILPVSPSDRGVVAAGPSTFSLANARVVADSGSQTAKVRRLSGRRVGFASIGLVVLMGFGLLLLHRCGASPTTVAHGAMVPPPPKVAPAQPPPAKAALATPVSKPAGEANPGTAHEASRTLVPPDEVSEASKSSARSPRPRSRTAKHTTMVPNRRLETSTPPTRQDQEDVAGF